MLVIGPYAEDDITLNESTDEKDIEEDARNCSEGVQKLKTTFDILMDDLEDVNTIPKLKYWYHNKSNDMYVSISYLKLPIHFRS